MVFTKCKYCEHGNPPDSKYCNSCGATLTLAPCPHCGAVNEVTAATCYQCRGNLRQASTDESAAALPVAVSAESASRRPSRVVLGTAAIVFVAGIGYYAYRQPAVVGQPVSKAPSADTQGRGEPAPPVPTSATPPVPAPATPPVPVAATPPPEVVPAEPVAAPTIPPAPPQAIERRARGQPAASPEATAGASSALQPTTPPAARPRATIAKPGEPESPRVAPCTERLAALGLCAYRPLARNDARVAPPVPAEVARSPATIGAEACTEAVAALGLCTPNSK